MPGATLLLVSLVTAAFAADPPAPRAGVAGYLGVEVGASFALAPLGPSVLPRIEGGIELPAWERRIRLGVAVTGAFPSAEGAGEDARVPSGAYTWELHQTEVVIQPGVTLGLPIGESRIVPEIGGGPSFGWRQSRVTGEAGGAAFPESTEAYWSAGGFATLGARMALGPGEIGLRGIFSGGKLVGSVTGEASDSAVGAMVGYRLVF